MSGELVGAIVGGVVGGVAAVVLAVAAYIFGKRLHRHLDRQVYHPQPLSLTTHFYIQHTTHLNTFNVQHISIAEIPWHD